MVGWWSEMQIMAEEALRQDIAAFLGSAVMGQKQISLAATDCGTMWHMFSRIMRHFSTCFLSITKICNFAANHRESCGHKPLACKFWVVEKWGIWGKYEGLWGEMGGNGEM